MRFCDEMWDMSRDDSRCGHPACVVEGVELTADPRICGYCEKLIDCTEKDLSQDENPSLEGWKGAGTHTDADGRDQEVHFLGHLRVSITAGGIITRPRSSIVRGFVDKCRY